MLSISQSSSDTRIPFAGSASVSAWSSSQSQGVAEDNSELQSLLARSQAGVALTPVESGTLARLMDTAGASTPTGIDARADGAGSGIDAGNGVVAGDASAIAAGTGAAAGPGKTAADFTIQHGTPQDVADLNAALSYLQMSNANGMPVSQTAVDLINSLPPGATINIIHDGNDQYDPSTQTIDWDPRSGLTVTSGQGTQSPALGLAHEMDHEVNGQANPVDTHDGYQNSEEQRVIQGSETTIANDFHEPTRTDHDGAPMDMGSSTDHTYWNDGVPPPFSSDIPGMGDGSSGYIDDAGDVASADTSAGTVNSGTADGSEASGIADVDGSGYVGDAGASDAGFDGIDYGIADTGGNYSGAEGFGGGGDVGGADGGFGGEYDMIEEVTE